MPINRLFYGPYKVFISLSYLNIVFYCFKHKFYGWALHLKALNLMRKATILWSLTPVTIYDPEKSEDDVFN